MLQTKVVQKIKIHILCSVTFFFENRAVYEIMWKNTVETGRRQMTVWRMRIACWIPKATNTHSQYVILIAFPLQQWLHERASMLCLYLLCLSCLNQFVSDVRLSVLWVLRFFCASAVCVVLGRHISRNNESSTICCSRHDALSITRYFFTPCAEILFFSI